jgi:hypothetical protein
MIVHSYNPSYLEGAGRRIMIYNQPTQNQETLSEEQTKGKFSGTSDRVLPRLARP